MTTPVSFNLAKLLKENGFDVLCSQAISEVDKELYHSYGQSINWNERPTKNDALISAPTIAEVVMWLYEKHTLWVIIYLMERSSDWSIYFDFSIKRKERGLINISTKLEEFDTPTAAYEAAIEYCLTKLL